MVQLRLMMGWRASAASGKGWVLAVCMAAGISRGALAEQPTYDVVGAKFEPLQVAVPETVTERETRAAGGKLLESLRRATRLVRLFELVSPKSYLRDGRDKSDAPRYANWKAVGASGLITSEAAPSEKGTVFTLRFYDVNAGQEQLGRKYTNASPEEAAFRFLDEIQFLLTGEKGIFSSKIAFVRRTKEGKAIYLAHLDGTGLERLTEPNTLSLLPAWDRDGDHIYFTSYLKGNPDLYRMNLKSKQSTWLSHRRGLNTGAAVSPDGRRIALTLTIDGNTEVYLMNRAGAGLTRLTNSWGQDISATWSPDGKQIAFVSSRSGQPHIYLMNADGSGQRRLTFKGDYNQEPDWSPAKGGKIVFTARDERLNYDIFLVDPASGDLTRLTQNQGSRNESPSFSPDGQQILFVSNRGGRRALYLMDVDGRNQRRISRDNAVYEDAAWGPRMGWD